MFIGAMKNLDVANLTMLTVASCVTDMYSPFNTAYLRLAKGLRSKKPIISEKYHVKNAFNTCNLW